jgi:hypothetical protein
MEFSKYFLQQKKEGQKFFWFGSFFTGVRDSYVFLSGVNIFIFTPPPPPFLTFTDIYGNIRNFAWQTATNGKTLSPKNLLLGYFCTYSIYCLISNAY